MGEEGILMCFAFFSDTKVGMHRTSGSFTSQIAMRYRTFRTLRCVTRWTMCHKVDDMPVATRCHKADDRQQGGRHVTRHQLLGLALHKYKVHITIKVVHV